jgi:glycosyltransferase involved in cell wall biosynthesis
MAHKVLHQFTEGMYHGDAVSDHVFMLQQWLRAMGFESEIYATKIEPSLTGQVRTIAAYQQGAGEKYVVYHHAVGSKAAEFLQGFQLPQILIYHNITPAEFYKDSDPVLSSQLQKGRSQLEQMKDRTILAVGDSGYNEAELRDLGYRNTAVLPIVLDESKYDIVLNEDLARQVRKSGPVLLFVGRLQPNKKQEDLITLLFFCRRVQPDARLILVGSLQNKEYVAWLKELAKSLGLDEEAVTFTGHINQQDLVTYYKSADLYVSMSEHEGFGKPLIESMYLGLPVLAYASTAVPATMGKAGILFQEKNFESLAELVEVLTRDVELRKRLIAQQKTRAQDFQGRKVFQLWQSLLEALE